MQKEILDVAFLLIWDNRYGGVSLDQICARARVNESRSGCTGEDPERGGRFAETVADRDGHHRGETG